MNILHPSLLGKSWKKVNLPPRLIRETDGDNKALYVSQGHWRFTKGVFEVLLETKSRPALNQLD